jgi:DNA replication and repair protein RecF
VLITNLNLTNYRSYTSLDLTLDPGVSIFVGKNGEGKTNIAEAVLYLTFLSSHRASGNTPLIKLGNQSAYIRAKVKYPEREILVELEINNDKANRAKVNQNQVRSQKEIFGIVQTIYFSPEDLDIVRGDPSERRRFIDQLLTLRSPRIAGVISDYERAVKQRNSLLKTRASADALNPWDKQVAELGGELITLRMLALDELKPIFNQVYKDISDTKPAEIIYKSSIENPTLNQSENSEKIIEKLINNRGAELDRGLTLTGPHRDDLLLMLGDHAVKGYASHGESWSIALSLKLATYNLLKLDGLSPILILDDVFSELDEERRERLAEIANSAQQTIITVAVENDLPKSISGIKYLVKSGAVSKL